MEYSSEQLLQAGDSEFLNWMVVLGVVDGTEATATCYMPDHVATGWGFVSWRIQEGCMSSYHLNRFLPVNNEDGMKMIELKLIAEN